MTRRAAPWSPGSCCRVRSSLSFIFSTAQLCPCQNWTGEGGGQPSLSWRESWWDNIGSRSTTFFTGPMYRSLCHKPDLIFMIFYHIKKWWERTKRYWERFCFLLSFETDSILLPLFQQRSLICPPGAWAASAEANWKANTKVSWKEGTIHKNLTSRHCSALTAKRLADGFNRRIVQVGMLSLHQLVCLCNIYFLVIRQHSFNLRYFSTCLTQFVGMSTYCGTFSFIEYEKHLVSFIFAYCIMPLQNIICMGGWDGYFYGANKNSTNPEAWTHSSIQIKELSKLQNSSQRVLPNLGIF